MAQDSAGAHACANYECVCAVPLHDGGNSPLGWQRNFCKLNAARSWKMEFVMCGFWVFHISPNMDYIGLPSTHTQSTHTYC